MLKTPTEFITIFIIISVVLILILVVFISFIIYRYQKNQHSYMKDIEKIRATHERAILESQIEIQEQTFQNISREIHDNIGQKLTLAKLQLNTLPIVNDTYLKDAVESSINMISEAILDLSDISRSMSSEIILNNGFIKALEFEIAQLQKSGLYKISFTLGGNPVFLEGQIELMLFRIVQEAFSNIIKHAAAESIHLYLNYNEDFLKLQISDDGKGFEYTDNTHQGIGLQNMRKRAMQLNGEMTIGRNEQKGTTITIKIPLHGNN